MGLFFRSFPDLWVTASKLVPPRVATELMAADLINFLRDDIPFLV
jgi:hypothetical protein